MKAHPLCSVLAALALLSCSASNDGAADGPGSSGNGNTSGSGAGASSTGGPVTGSAGSTLNVGSGGMGPGEVMNGECAHQDFNLTQKPAEILLVLDRSASMADPPDGTSGDSKWSLVVPGVNEVVTKTNSSVSWGLKVFPEGEGSACIAASVTNAIPVPIAASNAKAVTDAVTATLPKGNGTPTGDTINAAVTYLKTLSSPNPKFILLATDGEPSCANAKQDTKAARLLAVSAIGEAAKAGFKTFVVGVATTKDTATQALNDMAVAGLMPRVSTDPAAPKYYLASTKDALVQAMQEITGQVSSCSFHLTSKPPDPSNIAVKVNGMKAPHDTARMNGWDYTDSSSLEVAVYGSWCDQIKAASAQSVNFILGCPGEVIP